MPLKSFTPSTLETIDTALFEWVQGLNIRCQTNHGWQQIKVLWVSPERAAQIKRERMLRDEGGLLILPLITVERTGISKSPEKKGAFWADLPAETTNGGVVSFTREIEQEVSSKFGGNLQYRRNFQRSFPGKNSKIVYETYMLPLPKYIELSYDIVITAEYMQQMNEAVVPIITHPQGLNNFLIRKDGHAYEVFLDEDLVQDNNVHNQGEDDRIFKTTIGTKVLGFITDNNKNQQTPRVVRCESIAEFRVPREESIFGDKPPWRNGRYRE